MYIVTGESSDAHYNKITIQNTKIINKTTVKWKYGSK